MIHGLFTHTQNSDVAVIVVAPSSGYIWNWPLQPPAVTKSACECIDSIGLHVDFEYITQDGGERSDEVPL